MLIAILAFGPPVAFSFAAVLCWVLASAQLGEAEASGEDVDPGYGKLMLGAAACAMAAGIWLFFDALALVAVISGGSRD